MPVLYCPGEAAHTAGWLDLPAPFSLLLVGPDPGPPPPPRLLLPSSRSPLGALNDAAALVDASHLVLLPPASDPGAHLPALGRLGEKRPWAQAGRGVLVEDGVLLVERQGFLAVGGLPETATSWEQAVETTLRRILELPSRDPRRGDLWDREDGSGPGHRPAFLSGCLIVKDEERFIEQCLRSILPVVDEIVVYDTGSTDRTREIARDLGALVVEGYWDDDFARARNAAVRRCGGEWVLWLDADEVLVCEDPQGLRTLLRRTKPEIDAWSVEIENLTGAGVGAGFSHRAARLFRRTRCRWVGKLHEQLVRTQGRPEITQALLEDTFLRHYGYTDQLLAERHKAERNLRVAEADARAVDGPLRPTALVSLARSHHLAGNVDATLATLEEALGEADMTPTLRRLALRTGANTLIHEHRFAEAEAWIERLAAACTSPVQVLRLRADLALAKEHWQEALDCLDALGPTAVDEDGERLSFAMLAPLRAKALSGLQRWSEAADQLLEVLRSEGTLDTHLGELLACLERAGRSADEVAPAIPPEKAELFMAQVRQLDPPHGDLVLEALWTKGRIPPVKVLATAGLVAAELPVERALVWSTRIRQAGYPEACPLRALLRAPHRAVADRAAALGVLARLQDPVAEDLARELATELPVACYPLAASQLAPLAPALVTHFPIPGPEPLPPRSVSLVVPCQDDASLLSSLLASVTRSTPPGALEVILVDRGSTDATAQVQDTPDGTVRALHLPRETPLPDAWLAGAAAARNPVVLVVEPDLLATPNWLAPLHRAFEDPTVGLVAPLLLDVDGTVWSAGSQWVEPEPPEDGAEGDGTLPARLEPRGAGRPGRDPDLAELGPPDAPAPAAFACRRDLLLGAAEALRDALPAEDDTVPGPLAALARLADHLRAAGSALAFAPEAVLLRAARDPRLDRRRAGLPPTADESTTPVAGSDGETSDAQQGADEPALAWA
ncbi:glycosyltransferase [Aciditerrimonas ferrireducens]|uniref:glycosyltransferase n=1 Tax=Aciditerrimonas ferrireducens TaxID=667306 RepID=UPI0020057E40|nr:glycosyltransferase [Aciditerrimonas ferrireducens]MCK4177608.1 glycosyltransferase [Aciditerrimonas ferrireducens]